MKNHLFRQHSSSQDSSKPLTVQVLCELCSFSEPCNLRQYFTHLRYHLKSKETVKCPYQQCAFSSNVYSTFTAHHSRYHSSGSIRDFRPGLLCGSQQCLNDKDSQESEHLDELEESIADAVENEDDNADVDLQRKLASLFLRMQTLLHVSKSATQEIIDGFYEVSVLTGEQSKKSIQLFLSLHNVNIEQSTLSLIKETLDKTIPLSFLSRSGTLGTDYKRSSYIRDHFKVIDPVEYVVDAVNRKKFVYVPILTVLSELLNRDDVLDKVLYEKKISVLNSGLYQSFHDGQYFRENPFFSTEELRIAIGLYIDDFEICNPLGTSRNKHKICGVYWVLANLPLKYRSCLSSINLALLCNSGDLKTYGYSAVLEPLLRDLGHLENQGLYIERLGAHVQGTVAFVSADNLAAHSLAGFQESFRVDKCCRFCLARRQDIQTLQVKSGSFTLRTKLSHDTNVLHLVNDETVKSVEGVKASCVLNRLHHFHSSTGFPPDVLHDVLEGIVPAELSLCLSDLIERGFFKLDDLNCIIQKFPYKFSDKTNRPQKIPKTFKVKGSVGGNGHENWALLRLLPFMIGNLIPEHDKTWGIVLDLKVIVELLASPTFSQESVCFLESKISDHRLLLLEVFPDFKLKPKHHFVEHYPKLIHSFGPLLNFWTIRFEGKHSFFKKVVRDVNNFKNILLTLATKHQLMFAYYLDMPSLFKPGLEVQSVSVVSPDILDSGIKQAIKRRYKDVASVSLAETFCLHGTTYSEEMFVSVGSTSGLPDFGKIVKLLIVANKALFIVEPFSAVYLEHLGSYELTRQPSAALLLVEPEELNSYYPLYCYNIQRRLLVTAKVFLLH